MANLYVRSSDGNNVDNGSTWALAKASLAGAAAADAAGDTIYVSQAHAESNAAAQAIALAGTLAAPVKVICGNDAAEPPTAVAATATVTTTGNNAISFSGCGYFYGISFRQGTTGVSPVMTMCSQDADYQVFENCDFQLLSTGASSQIRIGVSTSGSETDCEWNNCDVKFSATGHYIRPTSMSFKWSGGSVLAGGTTPTTIFQAAGGTYSRIDIEGVDFSNCDAGVNFFTSTSGGLRAIMRNCKLPASWSGSLCAAFTRGTRVSMYNCDSGDTNYNMMIADEFGTIVDETTIVRTGGASDGTTTLSWKMVSGADAEYPHQTLTSPEMVIWNDTTASSKTVTVEIVTDNVTLTDAECWLSVQYLGTSGVPLGSFVSDSKADVLATAANQTSSTETWTTTGLATPVKQKLAVTFTPQEKGYFLATVKLAKASTTVYVDPKLTVT